MCLSPLRADRAYAFVALPTPVECARHTRGSSRAVAGAAEAGVGSRDPHVPSVQAQKGRASSQGARPCWLVRLPLPAGPSGPLAEKGRGKPGVSSGAVIYVAQPGCPWQAAPS